ncbi:uncharacterized protein DUF58 [Stella humosa]|uniref:Uncharacterized protein DUF58 n=1 Tax=Stella humosa TaxID=94 RepID=A0A3N1KJN9_9PROT|nr:DUF58 domain-containing protein [Stella humosa]ROP81051.1 uncharacterized protein DUF58 [Stella humosa]BBK29741.1 hypothetical protein STHU_03750 [Stella humosa]
MTSAATLRLRHRAEQAASRMPPLQVAAERVAATVVQGVHGRRRVGQGDAFWQYRGYEFGDAATAIDWRQSARGQRLFVRQNEWEAAQSVWLWRDASTSMRWSSAPGIATKLDRAELLLVALASLLARAGERVALLGGGQRPVAGRFAVERITEQVASAGDAAGKGALDGLPNLEPLPRHARTVLMGDFLVPLPDLDAIVRRLAGAGLRGHLVQIVDPAEATLPFTGRVRFEGMEAEGQLLLSRVETVRDAYVQRMRDHTAGLGDIARAAGWTHIVHHTDQPPQSALLALFTALTQRVGP